MAGLTTLAGSLLVLMGLYFLAAMFAVLASAPMIMHVNPRSECLLFSYQDADSLSYGNYATCTFVGYVFLVVVVGALFLFVRSWSEQRRHSSHGPSGNFDEEFIPKQIIWSHILVMVLTVLLTIIITAGYITACQNLKGGLSNKIYSKLNADPYSTRGEEIETRYEDDYKFHRYTNRYGNAFGSQIYTISITCRSIMTDPEIHQKLHDTHYKSQSRYFGYWYGQDLFAFDSEAEAAKTNALVEASLAGCWLCSFCWLGGFALILAQRYLLRQKKIETDRMSVHSAMMGSMQWNGSTAARKDGSVFSGSGRNSAFQRGGSTRGSDRSTRRDVDDIALSMHHLAAGGVPQVLPPQPASGYGRKEIDDMVINQHINAHQQQQLRAVSRISSRETGYASELAVDGPTVPQPIGNGGIRSSSRAPHLGSVYHQREEVETEIF